MERKRVSLVADELRGLQGGGIGTATSHLALALAELGHEVDVLYVGPPSEVGNDWAQRYDEAGIHVRMLERSGQPTEPEFFARMSDVAAALRADEPDVVVTQDLGAPAYVAVRLSHLGLAFADTSFVVLCHGTRRWITDAARKVRVLPGALAVTVLERASIELADHVVSPSAYLVEWMRRQGWRLPERTTVIPYVTPPGATATAADPAPLERVAFFGRLEDRKGIRPFTAGLDRVDPALLGRVELDFVGPPTGPWPPSRVEALLSARTRSALRAVSFHTELGHEQALAFLARPGTVVAMPSLEDNSPNTVYECLGRGLPFVASRVGGTEELVAPEDRARVLFEPTPEGVAGVLTRILESGATPAPARPAFDNESSRRRWDEVVSTLPAQQPSNLESPPVDVVVVGPGSGDAWPCVSALARRPYPGAHVTPVPDRATGARAGTAPWLVFLEHDDEPGDELVETLVRAQAASGADVVTCGSTVAGTHHLFLGEPGGLGLLSNAYGTPALVRRSLVTDEGLDLDVGDQDLDWRLLARLSLAGAKVASVPLSLVTRTSRPGRLETSPDAQLVLHEFESAVPRQLDSIARLAAGLAADADLPATAEPRGALHRLRSRFGRTRA